jgi:hypothetical protein
MNRVSETISLIGDLGNSCWAFCTLSAALELGVFEALVEPRDLSSLAERTGMPLPLVRRIVDVLASLDLVVARDGRWTAATPLRPLLHSNVIGLWRAELNSAGLQAMRLFEDARRGRVILDGWQQVGPELMQCQGLISAASTQLLVATTFHRVSGLVEQIQRPGATFLDAGAGTAGAAIALAKAFPQLHIVALEPNLVALRLARRNVAAAGLADRIELRRQRVENLRLREVYDAAHLAQAFFSDKAMLAGKRTVRAALRPGGWLLTTATSVAGTGLREALTRLRNELWGGGARLPAELARCLTDAKYVDVAELDGQATVQLVVGRRSQSRCPTQKARSRARSRTLLAI